MGEIQYIPRDEQQALRDAADERSDRVGFTINILLSSGMRVAEFSHMHEDWINWDQGHINVPASWPPNPDQMSSAATKRERVAEWKDKFGHIDDYEIDEETEKSWCGCSDCESKARAQARYHERENDADFDEEYETRSRKYWKPKTAAGDRNIPIRDERTWSHLERYFVKGYRPGTARGFGPYDHVIRTRQTLWDRVQRMNEYVKLSRRVKPHLLRHCKATNEAEKTDDEQYIYNIMGHTSIEQSMRYIHFTGDRTARKADEYNPDGYKPDGRPVLE